MPSMFRKPSCRPHKVNQLHESGTSMVASKPGPEVPNACAQLELRLRSKTRPRLRFSRRYQESASPPALELCQIYPLSELSRDRAGKQMVGAVSPDEAGKTV